MKALPRPRPPQPSGAGSGADRSTPSTLSSVPTAAGPDECICDGDGDVKGGLKIRDLVVHGIRSELSDGKPRGECKRHRPAENARNFPEDAPHRREERIEEP